MPDLLSDVDRDDDFADRDDDFEGATLVGDNRPRVLGLVLGLTVLGIFIAFGLLATRCGEPADRSAAVVVGDDSALARVRAALQADGASGASLGAAAATSGDNGRIVVSGDVTSEAERARVLGLARTSAGPKAEIVDALVIGDLRAKVLSNLRAAGIAGADVTVDNDTVVLTGSVPTEAARTQAESLAKGAVSPPKTVVNRLVVGSLAERVRARLEAAGYRGLTVAGATDVEVTLTGTVASAELRQKIVDAAREAAGSSQVLDQLTVASPTTTAPAGPKTAVATLSRTTVTLTGTVPDVATKDAIRAAAIAEFGDANVIDKLVIGPVADGDRRLLVGVDGLIDDLAVAAKLERFGKAAATSSRYTYVAEFTKAVEVKLNQLFNSQVLFDTGSAALTPEAQAVLNQVATALNGLPGRPVEISGHTDDVGEPASNLTLSQSRADSVKAYLVGRAVDVARLTAIGRGQAQPVKPNDSDENRRLNRRIEFKLG